MIQKLSEDLITKIAAGEVVERPSSVVKELIENALDAGSQNIKVSIEAGGTELIEVSDDGSGISREDLALACVRHATSKISAFVDLLSVTTLGFRGEALASISSVSQLFITSRKRGSSIGYRASYVGESLTACDALSCPEGTTVSVKRLFAPVPVRLKFLKSYDIETAHIADIVMRYALINPGVRFSLHIDGREQFATFGTSLRDACTQLLGSSVASELVDIATPRISGVLSTPAVSRKDKSQLFLFINGRAVKDPLLASAVIEGYGTLLFSGRFPVAVLNIHVEPTEVDVNVHPQKTQIKFVREESIFREVKDSVAAVLRSSDMLYNAGVSSEFQSLLRRPILPQGRAEATRRPAPDYFARDAQRPLAVENVVLPRSIALSPSAVPEKKMRYRILGQFRLTYLLLEDEQGLFILDQHAAHERILYEHFSNTISGDVLKQELLSPFLLTVSVAEKSLVAASSPVWQALGFEIDELGPSSIAIRSVPIVLGKSLDPSLLRETLIDAAGPERKTTEELRHHILATMSCRAAVKAGDLLSDTFIRLLVDKIDDLDLNATCPHGRPTSIRLSAYDFEKLFKRKA